MKKHTKETAAILGLFCGLIMAFIAGYMAGNNDASVKERGKIAKMADLENGAYVTLATVNRLPPAPASNEVENVSWTVVRNMTNQETKFVEVKKKCLNSGAGAVILINNGTCASSQNTEL